jgi:hypothetical protein
MSRFSESIVEEAALADASSCREERQPGQQ